MRKLKLFFIVSALLSFVSLPLFSEAYYTITETELTELENNLATYKQIATDLEIQTSQLKKSLNEYEKGNRTQKIKTSFAVGGITCMVCLPVGVLVGVLIASGSK